MQLSKSEERIYTVFRGYGLNLFTIQDLCRVTKLNKTKTYNIIKALKKKGAIKKWNKYFSLSDADELSIGSSLHFPSYISLWSALQYYGLSDQMPKNIFLVTTIYRKPIERFVYVTVAKHRFFGYTKIGMIVIAEKEKALIDALLFPKYVGGIEEIFRCFRAGWEALDKKKLIAYAIQIKSKAVLRRLGYLLEHCHMKRQVLEKIHKKIGTGYELLDPTSRKTNNFNEYWLLDINVDIK